jgi:hypothetical protein
MLAVISVCRPLAAPNHGSCIYIARPFRPELNRGSCKTGPARMAGLYSRKVSAIGKDCQSRCPPTVDKAKVKHARTHTESLEARQGGLLRGTACRNRSPPPARRE